VVANPRVVAGPRAYGWRHRIDASPATPGAGIITAPHVRLPQRRTIEAS